VAAGRPITDDDRRRVAELHAQGYSRNAIAREIGRSMATVSKIARELGLSFDRRRTAEATRAKVLDAKARRAQLALDLLADAERLRRQLWEPCVVYNFGGKDNTFAVATAPEPSPRDKREIMSAIGLALDKHARLVEMDADGGAEHARSMIEALADGVATVYRQLNDQPPVDDAAG